MSESIVIYRSKIEQQQDQYWAEHPEWILIAIAVVIAAVLGCWIRDRFWRSYNGRRLK